MVKRIFGRHGEDEPAAPTDDPFDELRAGFTASVSHELRTPLARLLALLDNAELPGADPREILAAARTEVESMRELVDDILFLSELETGRRVVSLGETAVLPVLRAAADAAAISADHAAVGIRVSGDETLAVPIRARMLRIVADNLVANTIRYAGSGTTLDLRAEREGNNVVVTAADDGAGVPEDDLPRLFERFYRSDRARASRGTGLGLALVKHVVTAAGGTVEATGSLGQGLCIRCIFPPR